MSLVQFHYGENNINTGPLKEIPEICVDHFWGDDLNSSVFFLSHAHTDHLVGLETEEFLRRLNQPGIKLYTHPLTPILLASFKRYLGGLEGIKNLIRKQKIIPLDIKKKHEIRIKKNGSSLTVWVTLLPAGHCPGSVMFLFETTTKRILHTGDFRLELEDLKRMSALHDENGVPKPMHHLYIDTTFCSSSANLFPNRKSVLKEAIEHIRSWIASSPRNIVDLRFSAKFAHEYVLLELYKTFQQKIHVTKERKEIYSNIPELDKIVTVEDGSRCQFHLCANGNCFQKGTDDDRDVIYVRFSSMWYTLGKQKGDGEKENISFRGKNMTICYSMHSSLEEIAKTIDYLKPEIVTPLVLPKKAQLSDIEKALRSKTTVEYLFKDYHSSRRASVTEADLEEDLCDIEKDETYLKEEDIQKMETEAEENYFSLSQSSNKSDEDEPLRKIPRGVPPELRGKWNFEFSPSPKSSQSSSDDGNSSQETTLEDDKKQDKDNDFNFVKPSFPAPFSGPVAKSKANSVCRNLDEDGWGGGEGQSSSNSSEGAKFAYSTAMQSISTCELEFVVKDDDEEEAKHEDDLMSYSQRLF